MEDGNTLTAGYVVSLRDECKRLRAERDRLREALTKIRHDLEKPIADYRADRYSFPINDALKDAAIEAYNKAGAALRGEGEPT